jgi:hypothetical protein
MRPTERNTLKRQTGRKQRKSRSWKANVGLDALLATVRDALHLGRALDFEASLAAASTV